MKLAAVAKQYLEDLPLQKKAASGIATYRYWLRRFSKWPDSQGYPDADVQQAFDARVLRRYRASMNDKANKTIRAAFHPKRELGRILAETGDIPRNMAASVPMPEKESPPRKKVSDAHVTAMINAVDRLCFSRDVEFMRAILYTLLYCDVHSLELVSIRISDLNFEEETLLVNEKGNKPRELSPPSEWWVAVHEWLLERKKLGCTHDRLFA